MDSFDANGSTGKCPVLSGEHQHSATGVAANARWWPNQVSLKMLHQNSALCSPMGGDFNYAKEFKKLNLSAVKKDLTALMTDSKEWWPADYGHYGPFFVRMAWHSAGTYRIGDGRGGARSGSMRFAPLNSWPDNVNLDKAVKLLWPIKQKYGRKLSWADLLILAGNVALESMGFKTHGFAGGREDVWEPEEDIYWGPETEWLTDERYTGDRELEEPLGAVEMGLIYVNPEGPNGKPDPLASAIDIRETFGRMAMNDEETVALIAGGHTFGKTHGAADAGKYVEAEPEAAGVEQLGLGWKNNFKSGVGEHAIGSGLEGAWTKNPIAWDNNYFENLFGYEWELKKGPGGGWQWYPENGKDADAFPDAHNPNKRHSPMMFTADLALREDPAYAKISREFYENPKAFQKAFAKAWYKLTHRDMGPKYNYLGKEVPAKEEIWQDPIPAPDYKLIGASDIRALKKEILQSGLSISDLVRTAWASASSYRQTDMRGGANGARLAIAPQRDWEVNQPKDLARVLRKLKSIRKAFIANLAEGKSVSLADVIVLGGVAAVEQAAKDAGEKLSVPFAPGRGDATAGKTDEDSFAVLEPKADGFRNYIASGHKRSAAELMVDKAHFLSLTAPEMTCLVGGLRVLGANYDGSDHGVLTHAPQTLTNDFFANVLDMDTDWTPIRKDLYEGRDRSSHNVKWTATSVDLFFGSNSQLRAISEHYGSKDGKAAFLKDFAASWNKVMTLDLPK